ncbi:MAG: adenylate/guanylate cyclase domain-containing protein [Pseudorhodoplanes sp.]
MFVWRLVAAGLPLDRASLHVGTLHPQLVGFAWNWNIADGIVDEVKVAEANLATDSFKRSPLAVVFDTGKPVIINPAEADADRFGLTADLRELGITQYLALPMGGAGYHNVGTVATRQRGGFTAQQRDTLERLLRLLALHVERHIAMRIAGNVLDTYLGKLAGGRVLEGTIRRGSGTRISAVIWASDLRGFTDLSDRLDPADMLAVLNAYFEALTASVIAHGGEVLKFMGDGLLAVFPHEGHYEQRNAAEAAVGAAIAAEACVAALNRNPPPELAAITGWQPLRSGIALHEGEVFFGNMGAPERLDFTVIGRAVNGASRVESMTKQLGRSILLTAPVAHHLATRPESLGHHNLRGMAEPIEIFGL